MSTPNSQAVEILVKMGFDTIQARNAPEKPIFMLKMLVIICSIIEKSICKKSNKNNMKKKLK